MVMPSSVSVYSGRPRKGKANKGEGLDENGFERDILCYGIGNKMNYYEWKIDDWTTKVKQV